jgi:hypothetical protein
LEFLSPKGLAIAELRNGCDKNSKYHPLVVDQPFLHDRIPLQEIGNPIEEASSCWSNTSGRFTIICKFGIFNFPSYFDCMVSRMLYKHSHVLFFRAATGGAVDN